VPFTHVFLARNWNAAMSGWALTASRVANSVGVPTPLSGKRSVLVVIEDPLWMTTVATYEADLPETFWPSFAGAGGPLSVSLRRFDMSRPADGIPGARCSRR
jgi:hypothetical protein